MRSTRLLHLSLSIFATFESQVVITVMTSTSSTRSAGMEPAADLMSDFELTVESTRRITSLLRQNEKISQNILLGMQLATDAACDAEEHQLQSEVQKKPQ